MANFLEKIAIDWSPAEQSTQAFVNKIIAEIGRIQKLPLTQQRSELSSGSQAITSRVQALGAQGVLNPRQVEQTLAQSLGPVKTAQAGVASGLVDVQAARRAEAASIRLAAVQENAINDQFRKDKAEAAATVRKTDQQARAAASAALKADHEYIASKTAQAADDRKATLEAKAFGLGIPPQGVAAGGATAETDQAYEARVVAAEKLRADRQKLANAKQLSKLSAEEVGIEAETSVLERQRQRELNRLTQEYVRQRIESGDISGGTSFQRIQQSLANRQGGPAKLPEEYQTLGQFASSKLLTTVGFALSGAAAYGALTSLKQIYSSEKDVQQAFTIIQGQLNEIGQGGSLGAVRTDIAGIAGDTGTAEALIAQIFPQIEGAFHNTRVALDDARTASEVAKITKTDLAATVNSLVPASVAFGVNFAKISDTAFGIQERAGVAASRTIELFGALGPVATQAGLSLKEVGAIAAAVLQDTTRAPANVAEDLNRLIPQLQTRTPLIYAALQSAGQGATGSEFVKDISSGKTGAAIGLLITAYNKLGPAQQQALEAATGSGRGTKDIVDLLLNQKVALDELNPALSDAGKTSKYFADLQKDLGQQASQVKEQLLRLGRSILESGAADALGHLLTGVALLVHYLGNVGTAFADANRLSHGFAGQLLEVAAAAKALQLILKTDTAAKVGTAIKNIGRPTGAHYPGSAGSEPKAPEVEFASAVNEAGQTFLATITKASETVATALSGGGKAAETQMAEGGAGARTGMAEGGAAARGEMAEGGAIARTELAEGAAASAAGKTAGGVEVAAGGGLLAGLGGFLGADVTAGSLAGLPGIVAALTGYAAFRGTSSLLGSSDHPNAAGRFENRALNDTLGHVTDLHFGGPKYKSPLDTSAYDQVHAAITDLGTGLQNSTGGALSNDEEKRIATDLKAAKSKNLDVVLAAIKDLNGIYADLKQRDPAAAAAAKNAQAAAGNLSQLTPDASGVVPLTTNVDNALAGYANGTDTLAGAISAAQQKLAGLPAADPRVKAAQDKVNKVISDALLQDQQLGESLQDNSVEGQQATIAREVALFNLPQFSDPGDRLALAKTVVANLKSELTAEADAATSTQERNRILAAGLAIPPEVRQAIAQQIVDTDPLLQQLLTLGSGLNKSITDAIAKDTANVVAGGKAVGDAYIFALQQELQFLTDMLKVPRYIRGLNENNDQILADIAKVQGDLDAATSSRNALNTQQGVPAAVTGPPKSKADTLSQQDALAKANADLASARAGGDKVRQAQIAQGLADQDLAAARAAKDDVKIAQALAAKERANQQLAAANDEVAAAMDNLQAAEDADDPIKAAQDAQKIADDQAALAKRTHDTVGAINAHAAQLNAGRQLAKASSDLGIAQLNLVKAQLEAAGDVVGGSKEQVTIIQKQIADFKKQHPNATLGNSAELNDLQAQLVTAQTDVGKTTTSFAEQQIQDNLDLKRITTGQAVAQLRALEDLQTNQHDRDEIEKKVRALLGSTGDLKMNLPSDILPTLYEARRLNGTATGSTYQGGTVDNRQQNFIFDGSDLQAVQRVVAAEVGSGSSRFGSTSRRY
jgi:hypothetical protein